jgi:hypothetical protein
VQKGAYKKKETERMKNLNDDKFDKFFLRDLIAVKSRSKKHVCGVGQA